jgi:arabinose-5-phosphate isomerase
MESDKNEGNGGLSGANAVIARAREVILQESRMLEALADQVDIAFVRTVGLLANCTGHVITSGVGTTGIIARRFAHLLCNVGCPALFLHAGDSLHGSSGSVRREDVLVLFSKTGETSETLKLAQLTSARGTPIVAFTARPGSSLGLLSTVVLQVKTPPEVDPYDGLMAVGSSLAMEAMCDALVFAVQNANGSPKGRFLQGHPGGVINAMRNGQDLG